MSTTKKRSARFNVVAVNIGSEDVPNFVVVKALDTAKFTVSETEVDVSDFDSEGWDDSLTTHRGWTVEAEGTSGYTGPESAQVDDPGQAHLVAKGLLSGPEAYTQVRFYRSDTLKGYVGRVTVNWGGMGDGVKAREPFKCSMKGSGKPVPYTHTP